MIGDVPVITFDTSGHNRLVKDDEVVESKWSGPCVHVGDGVIDIAVAENRQDGGARRSSEI